MLAQQKPTQSYEPAEMLQTHRVALLARYLAAGHHTAATDVAATWSRIAEASAWLQRSPRVAAQPVIASTSGREFPE